MKVNYNWLKDYVGDALPTPAEVERLLNAHAFEVDDVTEVAGETVIDVDVLPNRSSDCLCHRGIARELASILGVDFAVDPLSEGLRLTDLPTDQTIVINVADKEACPRFTASLMTGVEVKASPDWLKARLESLGQRSINNIVDATNYVMYAIGQPLHAYDADLFPQVGGAWRLGVRFARVGETVEILPEGGAIEPRVVECLGTELLIVDQSSDTPIGLAGVKGGQFAGVHADTKNIIIEAAHFDPIVVRKTARRLGIVIDASKRFENEPSRKLPPYGQNEIIKLIQAVAGGTYVGTIDQYHLVKENPAVTVRASRTNALLGLSLTTEEVGDLITRTGSEVKMVDTDTLGCTGPFERTDLNIEADFVDEVGRLYGLDNIQSVTPTRATKVTVNKNQYYTERLRQLLFKAGFSEVITSSFQAKDKIQLHNALASDKSYVRSKLATNMTTVLDRNHPHSDLLGQPVIKAFEIGTVFSQTETGIDEHLSFCAGVRSKGSGYTSKDDQYLRPVYDTLTEVTGTTVDFPSQNGVLEINLTQLIDTLDTPTSYDPVPARPIATFTPISAYPAVARDIALWVGTDTTTDTVAAVLRAEAGEWCIRLDLFDEFKKDDRVSYAFRLVFQSHTQTLTDSEVNTVMDKLYERVSEKGWEVR